MCRVSPGETSVAGVDRDMKQSTSWTMTMSVCKPRADKERCNGDECACSKNMYIRSEGTQCLGQLVVCLLMAARKIED